MASDELYQRAIEECERLRAALATAERERDEAREQHAGLRIANRALIDAIENGANPKIAALEASLATAEWLLRRPILHQPVEGMWIVDRNAFLAARTGETDGVWRSHGEESGMKYPEESDLVGGATDMPPPSRPDAAEVVRQLREALEPFASWNVNDPDKDTPLIDNFRREITVTYGDLRKSRAAHDAAKRWEAAQTGGEQR